MLTCMGGSKAPPHTIHASDGYINFQDQIVVTQQSRDNYSSYNCFPKMPPARHLEKHDMKLFPI
jgi:hypothetical protein